MLLDEIAAYLDAQVAGLTETTNLFKARMPDTPDTCVAVFEYSGRAPEHTLGANNVWRRPRFQILVRSASYSTARALIESCFTTLTFTETTLSGTRYMRCEPLQDPFALPRDANERAILACNFEAWRA
jgi:hypothetical protein